MARARPTPAPRSAEAAMFSSSARAELHALWDDFLAGDDGARARFAEWPGLFRYRPPWRAALRRCFDILEAWREDAGQAPDGRKRVIEAVQDALTRGAAVLSTAPDDPRRQLLARDIEELAGLPPAVFALAVPELLQRMTREHPELVPAVDALRGAILALDPHAPLPADAPTDSTPRGPTSLARARGALGVGTVATPDEWMDAFSVGDELPELDSLLAEVPDDFRVDELPDAPGEDDEVLEALGDGPSQAVPSDEPLDPPTVAAPARPRVTRRPPDPVEAALADPSMAEAVRALVLERWHRFLAEATVAWETERLDALLAELSVALHRKREVVRRMKALLGVELEYLGLGGTWGEGMWAERTWESLEEFARLAESNPAVRALAEMLGRYEAQRLQVELTTAPVAVDRPKFVTLRGGSETVRGVRFSDDLSRLTTGELGYLADPDLEILFYMKLLDRQLLTWDVSGEEEERKADETPRQIHTRLPDKKGPIILCIDTSASMAGEPELVAKTISLAMLRTAIRERRPCWAISYSHTRDLREVELTRFPEALGELVSFLSMGFRGGTDPVPALQAAIRRLETAEFDRADILWVTDGVFTVPDAFVHHLGEVRAAKNVRIHTLLVGKAVVPEFVDYCWEWTEGASFAHGGIQLIYGLSGGRG